MGLAKSHSDPNPENRKPKAGVFNGKCLTRIEPYSKVEHIIDQLYCDLLSGESRYHAKRKLMEGVYEGMDKGLKEASANLYLTAAANRIRNDFQLKQDEARDLLLARFESVFQDAFTLGDKQSALRALENIGKMLGISNPTPQTQIQINNDGDKGMTINFGYAKEEEEEDNES